MELFWWIIIASLAVAPGLLLKRRIKTEIQGIFFLWRTKRGLSIVKRLSKYSIFTYLADLGLVFAFGLFGAFYLIYSEHKRPVKKVIVDYVIFIISAIILIEPAFIFGNAIMNPVWMTVLLITGFGGLSLYIIIWATYSVIADLLIGKTPVPVLQPVIPGLKIPGAPIDVPLSAWISLLIVLVAHELSHAIVAVREKIRVKSLGIATAGVFPIGAFAEPDEKQMKREKPKKRLRIYAAGSMMNFVVTFAFIALMIPSQAIIQPMLLSNYYSEILTVDAGSPAAAAGLAPGMKIYNLNVLNEEKIAGTPITLATDHGNLTATRNATGSIGITFSTDMKLISNSASHWALFYYLEIVTWTAMLNFAVGMFNFLPFFIFDGARIFEDLADFYAKKLGFKKKIGRTLVKAMGVVIGLMFVLNLGIFLIQ
ncbi:site-2 protease family protein [Candidatus Micrarchaeota archaeon]|nr:site-2 protease family protein [Candidatus Micrarchaeota archaeon]